MAPGQMHETVFGRPPAQGLQQALPPQTCQGLRVAGLLAPRDPTVGYTSAPQHVPGMLCPDRLSASSHANLAQPSQSRSSFTHSVPVIQPGGPLSPGSGGQIPSPSSFQSGPTSLLSERSECRTRKPGLEFCFSVCRLWDLGQP